MWEINAYIITHDPVEGRGIMQKNKLKPASFQYYSMHQNLEHVVFLILLDTHTHHAILKTIFDLIIKKRYMVKSGFLEP